MKYTAFVLALAATLAAVTSSAGLVDAQHQPLSTPGRVVLNQCPQGIRERREIRLLSEQERQVFINALRQLQAGHAPTRYDEFAKMHNDMAPQAHGTALFLPWHRRFLRELEIDLQQIDPSIMLPFWDSSIDSQVPEHAIVFSPNFFGGDGRAADGCVQDGPFAQWDPFYSAGTCLRRTFDAGNGRISSFYSPEVIQNTIKTNTDFIQFSRSIEGGFHARVHNGIGGGMLDMYSPGDPLFFLHHGFVDRAWWQWQTVGDNHNKFNGLLQNGQAATAATPIVPWNDLTVGHVFDTRALCYTFGELPAGRVETPPQQQQRPQQPQQPQQPVPPQQQPQQPVPPQQQPQQPLPPQQQPVPPQQQPVPPQQQPLPPQQLPQQPLPSQQRPQQQQVGSSQTTGQAQTLWRRDFSMERPAPPAPAAPAAPAVPAAPAPDVPAAPAPVVPAAPAPAVPAAPAPAVPAAPAPAVPAAPAPYVPAAPAPVVPAAPAPAVPAAPAPAVPAAPAPATPCPHTQVITHPINNAPITPASVDRASLTKIRSPPPIPEYWLKMNFLPVDEIRKIETNIKTQVYDTLNAIHGYVSPCALANRGDILTKLINAGSQNFTAGFGTEAVPVTVDLKNSTSVTQAVDSIRNSVVKYVANSPISNIANVLTPKDIIAKVSAIVGTPKETGVSPNSANNFILAASRDLSKGWTSIPQKVDDVLHKIGDVLGFSGDKGKKKGHKKCHKKKPNRQNGSYNIPGVNTPVTLPVALPPKY